MYYFSANKTGCTCWFFVSYAKHKINLRRSQDAFINHVVITILDVKAYSISLAYICFDRYGFDEMVNEGCVSRYNDKSSCWGDKFEFRLNLRLDCVFWFWFWKCVFGPISCDAKVKQLYEILCNHDYKLLN